ncbi:MAG: hypothetical protein M0004_09395 [Actinomycetota bacterium]|nr:hypothetical protein [Actinomycetota bacterium]
MARPLPPKTPTGLPPVTALCMSSMACVIAAGIDLAAHLARPAGLGLAAALTAAGGAILLAVLVALSRLRRFAWDRFFLVARYAILAYVVIAGLLAFVFIKDGTRGGPLALLVASLVIFAINVPVILGFTVARYQRLAE